MHVSVAYYRNIANQLEAKWDRRQAAFSPSFVSIPGDDDIDDVGDADDVGKQF